MNYDEQLDAINLIKEALTKVEPVSRLTVEFSDARIFLNAARSLIKEGLQKVRTIDLKQTSR